MRQDLKDSKFLKSGGQREIMKCYACDGRGHRAADCPSRASTSRDEPAADFAEVIAINVGRQDMIPRIAEVQQRVPSSPHNNCQEDEALGVHRIRLDRMHARCKYHEERRRRKKKENLRWS